MKAIPYSRQNINVLDLVTVMKTLKSNLITQGKKNQLFERRISTFTGSKYSLTFNSATSALFAACKALDLGPGDWLWTSSISFVASANCGLYCGANVDFVDIDQKTYNICPNELEKKLIQANFLGKLPKVVVVVHFAGQSADMRRIKLLADFYGFRIIEDASHALGATYYKNNIGSCTYSDICIFSFHPVKTITTGEGGAITTNSLYLLNKMTLFKNHGITRNPDEFLVRDQNEIWNYQLVELGFNFRMTEFQAALGINQLKRMKKFIQRRRKIAQRYNKLLRGLPVILPWQHPDSESSFHLYPIQLGTGESPGRQKYIYEQMRKKGIEVNLHYIPIHLQPLYVNLGFKDGSYPKSEAYFRNALSLPIYPALRFSKQRYICKILDKLLT